MRIAISFILIVVIGRGSRNARPLAELLWCVTHLLCKPQARADRAHFQVVKLARLCDTWWEMAIQLGPNKAVEHAAHCESRQQHFWRLYVTRKVAHELTGSCTQLW